MADEFDERLKTWITAEIKETEVSVSLGAPAKEHSGRGVGLYLLEVTPSPPPSGNKRPALQLNLRYLITAWSDKPEEAHQILVQLMFAAMENKDFQVEPDSVPTAVWTALGVAPQPSFVLRLPLRQERPEPETPLVRKPLKVQSLPVTVFHGVLLGPGDVPLPNCRVEVPALSLSTSTDSEGRFHFPCVPVGPKKLLIKAKGRERTFNSEDDHADSRTPQIVHFSLTEE